ncbi:toxin-antitoxin system HicB family antitoxin [Terriglobus aquaticus]|uniref:Toxin-antitoxin system HicB family antitoxin n=1 Tax=Terriglobus aquaticus TaxID=940139 RepID=A0ABW9KGR2_9BACT
MDAKRPVTFPLRLPASVRRQAELDAKRDGVSLNQFITMATIEKLTRNADRVQDPTSASNDQWRR